jgi:site-specific DNA recombinase
MSTRSSSLKNSSEEDERREFLDQPKNDTPHDQLLLQIRGAVAEYERSLIAERMRRGRWQKYRAGGLLPWTCPPYGYRVDPARPRDPAGVRVEPMEAAVVAEMFASYAREGQSLMGVTRQLVAKARAQSLWAVSLESSECAGDCFQSDVYRNGLSWPDSSYSFTLAPLSSGSCRARPWWSSAHSV